MSRKDVPRALAPAMKALEVWERVHTDANLTDEQRQAFLGRSELSLLVNVSDDSLKWAIRKYRRIDEFVPHALAAELEASRKRNKSLAGEIESSKKEIRELTAKLKTSARSPKSEKTTVTNSAHVKDLQTRLEVALGRADKFKAEDEDWKKRAESLDPAKRPTTRSSHSTGPASAQGEPKPKPGSTRSSTERSLGPGHRASGWSATTRGPHPQFDDTEPCSQCGARISASAAASHECHF